MAADEGDGLKGAEGRTAGGTEQGEEPLASQADAIEQILDQIAEQDALDAAADASADALERLDAGGLRGAAGVSDVSAVTVDGDGGLEGDGLTEDIVDERTAWEGTFLRAEDVTVRLPNGRLAKRDVIRHPGAVAVIALTDDGKLVLVHQYRCSIEQVTLEIPAGKLEPGEDPQHAAARELVEETGYEASRMAYLGPIATAAGYSDEIIHIYMAMGLKFVGARPDDDEFLSVDLVDLNEMVDSVLDGKVVDSKTVIGVLLCDAIARRMEA